MPKVSVIIPNYNHARFLNQRIDSVLNQSFQDFEVIILDDCSTDNSREIIESYREHPKVSHVIFNEKNSGGPFMQWQKGIALAQGEYIWIAESDDYCSANFLEVALKSISTYKADIFVSQSHRVDENGNYVDRLEWWYHDLGIEKWDANYGNNAEEELLNYLTKKNTIVNASAVLFKNHSFIIDDLETIRSYKFCGDWLFWLMFLQKSRRLCYSVESLNFFRTHQQTTRARANTDRNKEVLELYSWICTNVSGYQNNYSNFKYFFAQHINMHPRRFVLKNFSLASEMAKIKLVYAMLMVKYYFGAEINQIYL